MENERFYLRKMTEQDYKEFLEVANEEAGVSCNADERFGEAFLEACQQNAMILSIIDRCGQKYIGYVIIKHTDMIFELINKKRQLTKTVVARNSVCRKHHHSAVISAMR